MSTFRWNMAEVVKRRMARILRLDVHTTFGQENMNETWTHVGTCIEGQPLLIDGIDVWKHKWGRTQERANIKDPIYGQADVFCVYTVETNGKRIEFAAGEFSNGVYGFFKRKHS